MTTGYEPGLVKNQFEKGLSIFACDEYMMFSNISIVIGPGVTTRQLKTQVSSRKGKWGSWANGLVFTQAWDDIIADGHFRWHDWVVKVDPDTVFFPNRLRRHLEESTLPGETSYVQNARGGYPIIGALEVISSRAIDLYASKSKEVCKDILVGSAEDWFIYRCLVQLGVEAREDFSMLVHNQNKFGCHDPWIAAFHPFKTIEEYHECIQLR